MTDFRPIPDTMRQEFKNWWVDECGLGTSTLTQITRHGGKIAAPERPEFVVHDDTCCRETERVNATLATIAMEPCAGRGVYWTPRSEQ